MISEKNQIKTNVWLIWLIGANIFFASKKCNQGPSNMFFIFSNLTWVVIFSRITTDFKYKLFKISSLWIYMPLMKKIWFTYAELAMPSYYVLWYLRCQIFSGALLPCTAYQASWLLDYTAAPGHSQTDWKGNNIFYCLLHNV